MTNFRNTQKRGILQWETPLLLLGILAGIMLSFDTASRISGKLSPQNPEVKKVAFDIYQTGNLQALVTDSLDVPFFEYANIRDGIYKHTNNILTITPCCLSGMLTLNLTSNEYRELQYNVIDQTGRKLKSGMFTIPPGNSQQSIHLTNLANGIYNLVVVAEKQYFVAKVVNTNANMRVTQLETIDAEKLLKSTTAEGFRFRFHHEKLFDKWLGADIQPNTDLDMGEIYLKAKPVIMGRVSGFNGAIAYTFKTDTLYTDEQGNFYITTSDTTNSEPISFIAPNNYFDKSIAVDLWKHNTQYLFNFDELTLKKKPVFTGMLKAGTTFLNNTEYCIGDTLLFTQEQGRFYYMSDDSLAVDTLKLNGTDNYFPLFLVLNSATGSKYFGIVAVKEKPKFTGQFISNGSVLANRAYVLMGDTLFTKSNGTFHFTSSDSLAIDTLKFLESEDYFAHSIILNSQNGSKDFGQIKVDKKPELTYFTGRVFALEDRKTEFGLPGINTPVEEGIMAILGNDTTYIQNGNFKIANNGADTLFIQDPKGFEGMGLKEDAGRYSKWFLVDSLNPGEIKDLGDSAIYLPKVFSDENHGLVQAAWHICNGAYKFPSNEEMRHLIVRLPDSILLNKGVYIDPQFKNEFTEGLKGIYNLLGENGFHFPGIPILKEVEDKNNSYIRTHAGGTVHQGETRSNHKYNENNEVYHSSADVYFGELRVNKELPVQIIGVHELLRVFYAYGTFSKKDYAMYGDSLRRYVKLEDSKQAELENKIGELIMKSPNTQKLHNMYLPNKEIKFEGIESAYQKK